MRFNDRDRELINRGLCPVCIRAIRGRRPFDVSAGDRFDRFFGAHRVDPLTGHSTDCVLKKMTHLQLRKATLRG